MNQLRVGIYGVSGYGGGELARLLDGHPDVRLNYVTSGTYADQPLSEALPGTAGRINLMCENFDTDVAINECDLLFLAGEAGLAMRHAPVLLAAGKKVIDLSADFRLQSTREFEQWYGIPHIAGNYLPTAVYGLPELYRERIQSAFLVANPGCYATAAILAVAPLLANGLVNINSIILDGLSGVSGAGRSKFGLDYHFSEVNESVRAYSVGGIHRHTPEIEQALSQVAGTGLAVTFTPHLVPMTRGILITAYAKLEEEEDDLAALYREHYADHPFVVVSKPGEFPATKHVTASNYCYIGVATDPRTGRAVVVSAIDNLMKGAAGQAVQNMNLMSGFDETAGLTMASVWP